MYKIYQTGEITEVYQLPIGYEEKQYIKDMKRKDKIRQTQVYKQAREENYIWMAWEIFGYNNVVEEDIINPELLEETSIKNREYYRQKQKIELRRTICKNFTNKSYFSTLTFSEKEYDIKKANKKVTRYIDKVRDRLKTKSEEDKKNMKYIFIPEEHEDGAIHYHGLIDCNLGFKTLNEMWDGICENKLIDSVDNVGAYVTSYITKTMSRSSAEKSTRMVLKSRNLQKVEAMYLDENPYEELAPCYMKDWRLYDGENIVYLQYNSNRKK